MIKSIRLSIIFLSFALLTSVPAFSESLFDMYRRCLTCLNDPNRYDEARQLASILANCHDHGLRAFGQKTLKSLGTHQPNQPQTTRRPQPIQETRTSRNTKPVNQLPVPSNTPNPHHSSEKNKISKDKRPLDRRTTISTVPSQTTTTTTTSSSSYQENRMLTEASNQQQQNAKQLNGFISSLAQRVAITEDAISYLNNFEPSERLKRIDEFNETITHNNNQLAGLRDEITNLHLANEIRNEFVEALDHLHARIVTLQKKLLQISKENKKSNVTSTTTTQTTNNTPVQVPSTSTVTTTTIEPKKVSHDQNVLTSDQKKTESSKKEQSQQNGIISSIAHRQTLMETDVNNLESSKPARYYNNAQELYGELEKAAQQIYELWEQTIKTNSTDCNQWCQRLDDLYLQNGLMQSRLFQLKSKIEKEDIERKEQEHIDQDEEEQIIRLEQELRQKQEEKKRLEQEEQEIERKEQERIEKDRIAKEEKERREHLEEERNKREKQERNKKEQEQLATLPSNTTTTTTSTTTNNNMLEQQSGITPHLNPEAIEVVLDSDDEQEEPSVVNSEQTNPSTTNTTINNNTQTQPSVVTSNVPLEKPETPIQQNQTFNKGKEKEKENEHEQTNHDDQEMERVYPSFLNLPEAHGLNRDLQKTLSTVAPEIIATFEPWAQQHEIMINSLEQPHDAIPRLMLQVWAANVIRQQTAAQHAFDAVIELLNNPTNGLSENQRQALRENLEKARRALQDPNLQPSTEEQLIVPALQDIVFLEGMTEEHLLGIVNTLILLNPQERIYPLANHILQNRNPLLDDIAEVNEQLRQSISVSLDEIMYNELENDFNTFTTMLLAGVLNKLALNQTAQKALFDWVGKHLRETNAAKTLLEQQKKANDTLRTNRLALNIGRMRPSRLRLTTGLNPIDLRDVPTTSNSTRSVPTQTTQNQEVVNHGQQPQLPQQQQQPTTTSWWQWGKSVVNRLLRRNNN